MIACVRFLIATALSLGSIGAAMGGVIVDQQFTPPFNFSSVTVDLLGPRGQSFTPALTALDFVTFNMQWYSGAAGSYVVDLREGQGVSGSLLASSNPVALPARLTPSEVQFSFPSRVGLTAGQSYSAFVRNVNPGSSNFALNSGAGNYPGGTALAGNSPDGNFQDFIFKEGIFDNVPLPVPTTRLIDQQFTPAVWQSYSSIDFNGVHGQSFKPAFAGMDFAILNLKAFTATGGSYVVDVRQGQGPNGNLVATSQPVALAGQTNPTNAADVEFAFTARVPLTPGNVYSMVIRNANPGSSNFGVELGQGVYAGGYAFGNNNTFRGEFYFQQGLKVPTPQATGPQPSPGMHVVDQEFTPTASLSFDTIDAGGPKGQSFTPDHTHLNYVVVQMASALSADGHYVVEIREGAGPFGALLGTSEAVTLPGNLAPTEIEFPFGTNVELIPGNTYSFVVRNLAPGTSNFALAYNSENYLYGSAFEGNVFEGTFGFTKDYYFKEGFIAVPEPGTFLLLSVALIGLGVAQRSKTRISRSSFA
jgi:hypothetical protein